MTRPNDYGVLGITLFALGSTSQSDVVMGAEGKAACDQALTDERVTKFWMRRVSLLRARALHNLAIGDNISAMADLDSAVSAVPDRQEPHYQRSEGIGIELARAYATRQVDGEATAMAIVEPIVASRPYSRTTALAGLFAAGGDVTPYSNRLGEAVARLDPQLLNSYFNAALAAGDYQKAVDLYGSLVPRRRNIPEERVAARSTEFTNWITKTRFWAAKDSDYAIALARLGRVDEARAKLNQSRLNLAAALKTSPPPLTGFLLGWMKTDFAEAVKAVETAAQTDIKNASDMVDRIVAAAAPSPVPAQLVDKQKTLAVILGSFPQAEDPKLVPSFGHGSARPTKQMALTYFDDVETSTVKVRFLTDINDVVEEMAMLAMAQRARDLGKDSFIIIDRVDVRFSLTISTNGIPSPAQPNGVQTELTGLFVDPNNLPEAYAGQSWRVLYTNAIIKNLEPLYGTPKLTLAKGG